MSPVNEKDSEIMNVDSKLNGNTIKRDKSNKTTALKFLYAAYKPSKWYWEIIETIRRLIMTAVLSVIKPGTSTQGVTSVLLSLLFIKLHNSNSPYHEMHDSSLAEYSHYIIILSCFGAIVIQNSLLPSAYETFLGIFLVVFNIWGILLAAYFEFATLGMMDKIDESEDKGNKIDNNNSKKENDVESQTERSNLNSHDDHENEIPDSRIELRRKEIENGALHDTTLEMKKVTSVMDDAKEFSTAYSQLVVDFALLQRQMKDLINSHNEGIRDRDEAISTLSIKIETTNNELIEKTELLMEVQSSYASAKEENQKLKNNYEALDVNRMQEENSNNENMKKNRMTIDHLQKELFKYKSAVLLNRGSSISESLHSPEPSTNRPKSSTVIKRRTTNLLTKQKSGKSKIKKMKSSRSSFKRKSSISKGKLNASIQQNSSEMRM